MKTLKELGISPAPWDCVITESTSWVEDYHDISIADTRLTEVPNLEISRADARLIAAAPELYEALRLWVEELCEDCQAEIGKTCDGKCEAVRRAVAALEKAGGAE